MKQLYKIMLIFTIPVLLFSCSKDDTGSVEGESDIIKFAFAHPGATKVTSTSFEEGDKVGIYLTGAKSLLELAGNYATNHPLVYTGEEWSMSNPLYWNSGTYDVYAYYPYIEEIQSVTDLPFNVLTKQNDGENYTRSDFLWASRKGITASDGEVSMQFSHRMSRMMIKLVKSEDYEGDIPEDAQVYIHNTVVEATVDLSAGIVTPVRGAGVQSIEAQNMGNNLYSALIVPQRLNNRVPLVEVVMKGVSYLYETKFLFRQGKQHNVTLVISKNPEQIKIEIGGEIEDWS